MIVVMKLQSLSRNHAIFALRHDFHSSAFSPNAPHVASKPNLSSEDFISKLLTRKWTLTSPDTKIHQIVVQQKGGIPEKFSFSKDPSPFFGESMIEKNNRQSSFYIVRDDLLHPLVNGNKARKLDALLPLVEDHLVTDVVTCGGCQSAHAAAVAVSCAERGLKSHLLLRGEQPQILTGYNLISMLYGNVTYVPRNLYANREEMFVKHADSLAGSCGSFVLLDDLLESSFSNYESVKPKLWDLDNRPPENARKIAIVNEGAGDAVALLGVIRLVHYLSQDHLLGKKQAFKIVVDAGTGTTAIGLAIGALCLRLPWEITALMLADKIDGYRNQEQRLISEFCRCSCLPVIDQVLKGVNGGIVRWVERKRPRKFGNVLEGEVEACQQIAQQTGVLMDPIYTLAAWELATQMSLDEREGSTKVVMLHTGGTLGMFGLAQRYKSYF